VQLLNELVLFKNYTHFDSVDNFMGNCCFTADADCLGELVALTKLADVGLMATKRDSYKKQFISLKKFTYRV
jgi:hypothetical protein